MELVGIANVALSVVIIILGVAAERRVRPDVDLEMLPWYLQLFVGAVAISPLTFFDETLAVGPIDGLVVALALSAVLWLTLPIALSHLFDVDETTAPSGCRG